MSDHLEKVFGEGGRGWTLRMVPPTRLEKGCRWTCLSELIKRVKILSKISKLTVLRSNEIPKLLGFKVVGKFPVCLA